MALFHTHKYTRTLFTLHYWIGMIRNCRINKIRNYNWKVADKFIENRLFFFNFTFGPFFLPSIFGACTNWFSLCLFFFWNYFPHTQNVELISILRLWTNAWMQIPEKKYRFSTFATRYINSHWNSSNSSESFTQFFFYSETIFFVMFCRRSVLF